MHPETSVEWNCICLACKTEDFVATRKDKFKTISSRSYVEQRRQTIKGRMGDKLIILDSERMTLVEMELNYCPSQHPYGSNSEAAI